MKIANCNFIMFIWCGSSAVAVTNLAASAGLIESSPSCVILLWWDPGWMLFTTMSIYVS